MLITLVTIAYYDTVNAVSGTLYYSTAGYVSSGSATPPHTVFDARLKQACRLKRTMFGDGTTRGRSKPGTGELVLRNSDGELDALRNYAFDGRQVLEYVGEDDALFPSGFTQTIRTTVDAQPDFSADEVRFRLRDRIVELQVPLQTTKYAGDNSLPDGLEGVEDLKGKPKPWCFGDVFNVPAVPVNTSKLIYQVHDGAIASISDVRARGISLAQTPANVTARSSGVATRLNKPASNATGTVIVVGAGGVVRRSTDYGATWAAAASSPLTGTPDLYAAVWDPVIAKFVVGGDSEALWYSADGDTFTQITGASNPFGATERINKLVSNGNGTIMGLGSLGIIATSTNGTSFTSQTHGFGATDIITGCWGRNEFAAVNTTGRVESSPTGVTWTVKNTALSGSSPVTGMAFGRDRYVVVYDLGTGSGQIYSSVDLISWAQRGDVTLTELNDIEYGGKFRLFVAAGGTGTLAVNHLYLSVDGEKWWTVSTTISATDYMDPVRGICLTATEATFCGQNENGSAEGYIIQVADVGTYGSEADLLDDTLQPKPGTYKVYATGGLFRLGSPPAGLVTCDFLQGAAASNRTAGQGFASVFTKLGKTADYSTADVTALDASRTDVLGFWSGLDEWQAADVLDMIANSVNAWWGPDYLGVFRIQLGPLTTGTSQLTITANDMLGPPKLLPTNDEHGGRPAYRVKAQYRKNYAVQDQDLAGGVTDANRALYSQEYREETATDATVQDAYQLAPESVMPTLLTTSADASSKATRDLATYDSRQDVIEVVLPITPETSADVLALDIGDVVTIEHDRFGLSAGRAFAIITIDRDPTAGRILLQGYAAA